MNDLEKIYERLKKSFLEKGYKEEDISESKLRQQAWVNMDREIRKKRTDLFNREYKTKR